MSIEYICRKTAEVKKKYDETDPFRLAKAMKCLVLNEPMGDSETSCKGFFMCKNRINIIVLNSDMPYEIRRIVLAHELGHVVLHRKNVNMCRFHDHSLYDTASMYEYEANIFASELLLDDDDVLNKLGEDSFFFGAAHELQVPPEMLDFKFRILKSKGKLDISAPISSHGDYLKRLKM